MSSVTLLYAGLLVLLGVVLANYVLYIRLRVRGLESWKPNAAERVQANFVENVPLALILLYLLEQAQAPLEFVHVCGAGLVLLRVLHAWGLARYPGANYPRLIGAQGTFVLLSVMGVSAIYLSIV